ncbi:MAG: hypothetical protein M1415_11585, partial [Firmicutes bacterium]|nr:hypothetical protein [Bacillota bacterium]
FQCLQQALAASTTTVRLTLASRKSTNDAIEWQNRSRLPARAVLKRVEHPECFYGRLNLGSMILIIEQ